MFSQNPRRLLALYETARISILTRVIAIKSPQRAGPCPIFILVGLCQDAIGKNSNPRERHVKRHPFLSDPMRR
jgi:hypothetical protein